MLLSNQLEPGGARGCNRRGGVVGLLAATEAALIGTEARVVDSAVVLWWTTVVVVTVVVVTIDVLWLPIW